MTDDETTELALSQTASGTANTSGFAVVVISVNRPHETWHVTNVAVQATGTAIPYARIYRGGPSPGNLVDGTARGNLDSSDTTYDLQPGEYLTVTWTGADVGASCTVTIQGKIVRRGRIAY